MKSLRNRNIYFIYLAVLAFYIWMAAQIPYTGDDWDWGSAVGMEQFLHATVNSRYVGNFFEVVMTRSEFLKVAFMGVSYFLIPFLLMRIAAKDRGIMEPDRQLLLFLLCNCLILTMNHVMWREVYGWTAGFANFGISALFLLLWLKELLKAFDGEPKVNNSPGRVLLYLVAGFCGQLFIENLAIYCVLLACVLCGIYYYRFRRVPCRVLAMGIGAVGGLVVMFSSSIYQTLFTTGKAIGGGRSLPILSYSTLYAGIYELGIITLNIGRELYDNNLVLTLVVLLILSFWMRSGKSIANKHFCKKTNWANYTLMVAFVLCHIYDIVCKSHLTVVYLVDFIVSIAYFLTISIEIFFSFRKGKRGKLLALWLSPPILIAPLLLTTELGQRLFYTTNIAVLLFLMLVISGLMEATTALTLKRAGVLAVFIAVLLFGFYGQMYSDIGACKETREDLINEALTMGQKTIEQPGFPHDEYLHGEDPDAEWRLDYYKEFYGIPADVELIFESLNQ